MTQLEYLIALVSIIIGLGLTDLAQSFRELVRPEREVRWHWLPLTWAAISFLVIVQIWWGSFRVLQNEVLAHAAAFTPVLLGFLLLYLICAFALPDPEWASPKTEAGGSPRLDLEAFYFSMSHRRWFFGTFIGLLVVSQVFAVARWAVGGEQVLGAGRLVQNAGVNFGVAALLAGLIVTDQRWVHTGTAILVAASVLYTLIAGVPMLG